MTGAPLNTNWRRLTLIAFLLALAGLVFNPNPALAQEPAPTIPAPTVATTPPSTYFVVVGAQDYKNAPDLTGTEGGEYDCRLVADHLRKQGFDTEHLMSLCGPELVRERLFTFLNDFMKKVTAGSTMFVIWIGHGGTDPVTGNHVFATADGSFDLFSDASAFIGNTGYSSNGIDASLLYYATQRMIPTNARVVFVTDTARGGTYEVKGGTILLEGPSAEDFADMPGVYALSPTPGKPVPVGLTRQTLMQCLTRPVWSETLSARKVLECYTDGMTKGGLTIEMAGTWREEDPLVFFPQIEAMPAPPKPPVAKIVVISVGGAVTVTGAIGSVVTYVEARKLGEDIEAGKYGVAGDTSLTEAVGRYNRSAAILPVWYAVTGVGAAVTITGIALPVPHNARVSATATIVPGGMVMTGRF